MAFGAWPVHFYWRSSTFMGQKKKEETEKTNKA